MCIKPVAAFEDSKGNMFREERCAIQSEIGIVTGFSLEDVLTIIGKASPLIPLLQRVLAIAPPPAKPLPTSGEPTTLSPYENRARLLGRIQTWAQVDSRKPKQFLAAGGYESLTDLNERATDMDISSMHVELDNLKVA